MGGQHDGIPACRWQFARHHRDGSNHATIPEFRRLSGISRSRIYELLDEGKIESIYIGARRLILIDSYRQLIERQRQPAKAGPR
jgi:hypothetical protein